MSVLVIQMPARVRLGNRVYAEGDTASAVATEGLNYVLSGDSVQIDAQGRAPAPLLPKADSVVVVLADTDISWHRVTLPKAPASKMRAALSGLLEEQLLDDDAAIHFAIGPMAMGGQLAWIAAINKPWLAGELARLDSAGVSVDNVVPMSWPGEAAHGHFYEDAQDSNGNTETLLSYGDIDNLTHMRLAGSLAKSWLPRMAERPARWTATPAVAASAERWLGATVSVLTDAERMLAASRSPWSLRQFDLAPRHRGARAARNLGKQFMRPGWKPVRYGLVALLALQLVGLNAWAWVQQRNVANKRAAMVSLLQSAHPQVKAVLDAPLQMQRETDLLRGSAGRAGEQDFEALLAAAGAAWPEGMGPTTTLRFEPGRLTLGATSWSPEQISAFSNRLRLSGLAVEAADGRLTLSVAAARKAGS